MLSALMEAYLGGRSFYHDLHLRTKKMRLGKGQTAGTWLVGSSTGLAAVPKMQTKPV